MYVSSYNTYIQSNTSNKTQDKKVQSGSESSKFSFNSSSTQPTEVSSSLAKSTLPVDYTKNSKSFANKHKIQAQENLLEDKEPTKSEQLTRKFQDYRVLQDAKSAYENSSKFFSYSRKPSVTLNQPQKTDEKLPKNIKDIKENNLRNTMINTYMQNEIYYQITA